MRTTYEVARPITAEELPTWDALADALAENRLPVMAVGGHLIGRLTRTRRGRAALPSVGRIACAVAATLALPETAALDVLRSQVIPLSDAALDAYEELLREVRPIVHDVVLAERLRRSGSLAATWRVRLSEVAETRGLPEVLIPIRKPRPPAS